MGENEAAVEALLEPGGYRRHKIVITAVKMGLFTRLADGPRTGESLAAHYGAQPRAMEVLLNALAALGLVEKAKGRFSNGAAASRALVEGRAGYRGDQLVVDEFDWEIWGGLEEALRSGSPLKDSIFRNNAGISERLLMGLHQDALSIAEELADRLPLQGRRDLLDVGGGAGTYSMAFCERYPELQATIIELPIAARVARRVIQEAGLGERVRVEEGDVFTRGLPGSYDVIFISNMLHGQGPEENQALFKKMAAAVRPEGIIVVRDVLMDDERTSPQWGALFAVSMLLHTARGRTYSRDEVSGWLTGAGCSRVEELVAGSVLVGYTWLDAGQQQANLDRFARDTPMRRVGQPADIANAVL